MNILWNFTLNILKLFFLYKKNIIWLTFYRLLLNIGTALYIGSGKLQKYVYTMKW